MCLPYSTGGYQDQPGLSSIFVQLLTLLLLKQGELLQKTPTPTTNATNSYKGPEWWRKTEIVVFFNSMSSQVEGSFQSDLSL